MNEKSKTVKCPYCRKEFSQAELEEIARDDDYTDTSFDCPDCDERSMLVVHKTFEMLTYDEYDDRYGM